MGTGIQLFYKEGTQYFYKREINNSVKEQSINI